MNIILQGIVGSTAYGLATPSSDEDRLGIFQAPTSQLLRLDKIKESYVESHPDPDRTLHELGKYLRLALSMNPTVTELLWLSGYETLTEAGQCLLSARSYFLSARGRATYSGYAKEQIDRLDRRPDKTFASDLRKRTEKHGRHCRRLLIQCEHLLTTGEIQVRLTPDQAAECFAVGEMAGRKPDEFKVAMYAEIARIDALPTDLPEHPDKDFASDLLLTLRLKSLESE